VTDVSSKGLIPQLTDVLHALTDSHERLLVTVQALRQGRGPNRPDHAFGGHTFPAKPLHSEPPDRTGLQSPSVLGQAIAPTNGLRDQRPPREVESVNGSKSLALGEFVARPVIDPLTRNDAETELRPDTAPPPLTQSEDVAAQDDPDVAPPPDPLSPPGGSSNGSTNGTERAHSNGTQTTSGDRNYNFFDELDAKLTDIQDPDVGPGEHHSS
jgi:hypothetical protein